MIEDSNARKRKTLHEYFTSSTPQPKTPSTTLRPTNDSVPGLTILNSFISITEEQQISAFLSTQSWRTDLSRRSIHYGGTYCRMPPRDASPGRRTKIENDIITAAPMPKELGLVLDRMMERGVYPVDQRPEYCIVNEYTQNQGISAHVENFRFDEPVCGLTLGDGDFIRFHELENADDGSVRSGKARLARRTGRRVDVWLPCRSLCVMRGDSRWRWQHEIVRGRRGRGNGWRRVSLTFRTLRRGRDY